ncbi:hypothetical protein JYU34_009028 [Plutella xylostella]|uniref:Apple domain-containing protein n=1 Tax=Plutella xylostella TaxID=51655 RepID=A0ABQ7QN39_PLUXY|nr:hypothetical protein JYU34_009028 [Plutella xylostella]
MAGLRYNEAARSRVAGVGGLHFMVSVLAAVSGQCSGRESLTFMRWSGVTPGLARPVFVYSASGDEPSLTGACLARCRELDACAAVAVAYGGGNCQGVAASQDWALKVDSDAAFFQKTCLECE